MRNSNSRDKPSPSTNSQNRLMKTQVTVKNNTKQSLNATQYRLPPSNKRIQSSKNSSTNVSTKQISKPQVLLPSQFIDYDIQSNMTESKIYSAKQSLQLLKKKMNRTGMSRQKIVAPQSMQKTNYTVQSMKKIKSNTQKNLENYEQQNSYNNTKQTSKYQQSTKYQQKVVQSKYQQQQTYNKQEYNQPSSNKILSKKNLQQKQQKIPLKKIEPIPQQTYYNQRQQIPISKKQDFQALLQKQLQKQQFSKNQFNSSNKFRNQKQYQNQVQDQQVENGEVFQCSKGCGRRFNEKVLLKHQKICQKVFQSKRKVFNVAAQRQAENGAFHQPHPLNKLNQTKKPQKAQPAKTKIPKWKLQSAQFRAGLKGSKNIPLTAEEQALSNMQKDSLVPCSFCGRKFNQTAASRHIQFCQKKFKQMPRPSNGKRK